MAEKSEFYFKKEVEFDEKAKTKFLKPEIKPQLEKVLAGIKESPEFTAEVLETLFKDIVEKAGLKLGKLAQPVRVALTGTTTNPGIYDTILLLGKERTLERLGNAIQYIDSV